MLHPLRGCLQGEFTAENIKGTAIRIHWTFSTDSVASEYKIYAVNSDNSLTLLGRALSSESFFDDTGLVSGHLYRYVVRMGSTSGSLNSNKSIFKGLKFPTTASILKKLNFFRLLLLVAYFNSAFDFGPFNRARTICNGQVADDL